MNKIEVLDANTIDKIAAGEVVERPSSVVKELVENAIDAGATAVTVEIQDGGKKLIRITDNGCGIDADEVRTAFLRHATSKIRTVDDLVHVSSLGFRGEALSSIAAVSEVELITRTQVSVGGTRYLISGGTEVLLEETGAPEGTTFLVRNLFFNVPARSKFLKSDMTEAGAVSALMEQLAMSHPEVSFKYIQNRQVRLHSSGNNSMKDVIYSIYGREIIRSLLEISFENEFMKVQGFIGKPEIARGNRGFENYYVNGRYVKDKILSKAIEDGYQGFLMQHKFPFVALQIEMNGADLDVNVHPSKMEVRFSRSAEVYQALMQAVRSVLSGRELISNVTPGRPEKEAKDPPPGRGLVPEPFESRRRASEGAAAARTESFYGFDGSYSGSLLKAGRAPSVMREETREYRGQRQDHSAEQDELRKMAEQASRSSFDRLEEKTGRTGTEGSPVKVGNTTLSSDAAETKDLTGEKINQNPRGEAENMNSSSSGTSADVPGSCRTDKEIMGASSARDEGETEGHAFGKTDQVSQDSGSGRTQKEPEPTLFTEALLTEKARSRHILIGQLFNTYWLVQFENTFYIIDQHAAHEKVVYERLVKSFRERTVETQYLKPPILVTLTLEEESSLQSNMDFFTGYGFEIEHYGGREYLISGVPTNLYHFTEEQLFREMLDQLSDGGNDMLEIFSMRLATMACKAAVKGNNRLSVQEADALIDELLSLENPYNCPHGRPTIIAMSKEELEKKFHRIV